MKNVKTINGIQVVSAVLPIDPAGAKDLVFKVRSSIEGSLLCAIGSIHEGKPMINVMVSEDLVKDHGLHAGQMVREAAKLIKGGGGGQPHFASAGGKDTDGLSAAIDKVVAMGTQN